MPCVQRNCRPSWWNSPFSWLSVGIQSRTIDSGCSPCNYFSLILTFGRGKGNLCSFLWLLKSIWLCATPSTAKQAQVTWCELSHTSLGCRLPNSQISMCGCRGRQFWRNASTFWCPSRICFGTFAVPHLCRQNQLNSSLLGAAGLSMQIMYAYTDQYLPVAISDTSRKMLELLRSGLQRIS